MKYAIWRILGNAFPPRYALNQNEQDTTFILEWEEHFPEAEKVWVLNRIADEDECNRLESVIKSEGHRVIKIPFDPEKFRSLLSDDAQFQYATNVNAARNVCVYEGLKTAEIVVPLGGGTMFRFDAWQRFKLFVEMFPDDVYYALAVWRGTDTEEVLGSTAPLAKEAYKFDNQTLIGVSQPRVVFTHRSDVVFDVTKNYAANDYVDLLWRLGILGVWDRELSPEQRVALKRRSRFFSETPLCSWVYKLPRSESPVVLDNIARAAAKVEGKKQLLKRLKHLTEG